MAKAGARIAIIGAGPGGLAAAVALRDLGFAATVFEQAVAFMPGGAGIQLTPNASKTIKGLSILKGVRERSYAPKVGYNRVWDTGEVTNPLGMGAEIEAAYGAPDLAMHRAVLHEALAARLPAGAIRLGKRLSGLDTQGESYRLRFGDGTDECADAVIGADGIHSILRELLLGADAPRFSGRVAYRTTFSTTRLAGLEVDGRVKWWGPDRHIVSYLLTPQEDAVYYIAVTEEPDFQVESWSTVGDLSDLLAAFEGFHPKATGLLGAAPEVRKWALLHRDPLQSWGEAGVVLLGDACHPMPPYIAQGAAAAMEDAVILARCVADATDISAAFARYQALRHPRTTRMQVTAEANTWMRYPTDAEWVYGYDPWTASLDVGLAATPEEPSLRDTGEQ